MKPPSTWSQRLLRKGSFAEETFSLFRHWDFALTVDQNLAQGFKGQFKTRGWEKEVRATTHGRLRNFDGMRPLIVMAQGNMPFSDWRDCYRLWLTVTEEPYGAFVMDWLHQERESGRFELRAEDVRPFVVMLWEQSGKPSLSDYGQIRSARDLMKLASEMGLLTGTSPVKTLTYPGMSDLAFLFHLQMISEFEGTPAKVIESSFWRSCFMAPSEVHHTLLRLHQYRKVDYQVAGSLVQLTLPYPSSMAFAEAVAA
jgi:hypothetical protein